MKIEIRSKTEARIEGYVNVCGRESRAMPSPHGRYTETVRPGTFQQALNKGNTVQLKFNHGRVLGGTDKGNLELREDNIGLYAKAVITDTDIISKAERKELRGWSFGFYDNKPTWNETKETRSLEDIDLIEVSILDKTPAYIATSIEMRGGEEAIREYRSMTDDVEYIGAEVSEKTDFAMENCRKWLENNKMRG